MSHCGVFLFRCVNDRWAQPSAVYDPRARTILLQFTNETAEKPGGCDNDAEQLGGVLQLSSTDGGRTYHLLRETDAWRAHSPELTEIYLRFPSQPSDARSSNWPVGRCRLALAERASR